LETIDVHQPIFSKKLGCDAHVAQASEYAELYIQALESIDASGLNTDECDVFKYNEMRY